MPVVKNVVLMYTRIKNPDLEFEATASTGEDKDYMNKEYSTQIVMPESEYKKLDKKYGKRGHKVKMLTDSVRFYSAKEYEAAFKVKPPESEDYVTEDGYVSIKFSQKAYWVNSGDRFPAPRVVGTKKGGTVDNDGNEINGDVGIGNGTIGHMSFRERTFKNPKTQKQGLALDLTGVQVHNLVPYVNMADEDEFEYEDDDFEDDDFEIEGDDDDEAPTPAEEEDDDWDE